MAARKAVRVRTPFLPRNDDVVLSQNPRAASQPPHQG
jgi:hypothetical protein